MKKGMKNGRSYPVLQVCLPQDLVEWVEQQAKANERSASAWVRLLIRNERKYRYYKSVNL